MSGPAVVHETITRRISTGQTVTRRLCDRRRACSPPGAAQVSCRTCLWLLERDKRWTPADREPDGGDLVQEEP